MAIAWSVPDALTALFLAVAFVSVARTWSTGTERVRPSPAITALVLTAALAVSLFARPVPDTIALAGAGLVLVAAVVAVEARRASGPAARSAPGTPRDPAGGHDAAVLLEWIDGHWRTHLICAAASTRLPDHLDTGPLTTAELAAATGTPEPVLDRLLSALQLLGVVHRVTDRWALTRLGAALGQDAPGGAHHRALVTSAVFLPLWSRLPAIAHGAPAGPEVAAGEADMFGRLLGDARTAAAFDRLMAAQTDAVIADLRIPTPSRTAARSSTSAAGTAPCSPGSWPTGRGGAASCSNAPT